MQQIIQTAQDKIVMVVLQTHGSIRESDCADQSAAQKRMLMLAGALLAVVLQSYLAPCSAALDNRQMRLIAGHGRYQIILGDGMFSCWHQA